MELPISLLAPPTSAPANAASTSMSASAAKPIPVVAVKKESKKKHHLTTATDPLFVELRDLNFSSVGKKLNRVARRLDEDYKVKSSLSFSSMVWLILFVEDKSTNEDGCPITGFCWEVRGSPD